MARVTIIDPKSATGEAKQLLAAVESGLGMVPNFIRVLANSPAALGAFLGLHGICWQGVDSAAVSTNYRMPPPYSK